MEKPINDLDRPEEQFEESGGMSGGTTTKKCVCTKCPHNKKGVDPAKIAIKIGIFVLGLILGLML